MFIVAVVCAVASSAVPSPGRVIFESATRAKALPALVAASPDPEEEQALEEDMARARRRLGHDDGAKVEAKAQDTINDDEAERGVDDAPKKKKRKKKERRQGVIDEAGHGKNHYLVWGIIDWSLAGGMWVGSLVSGVISAGSFVTAREIRDGERAPARGFSRSDAAGINDTAGIVFGVVALGLGGLGGFLALKASDNVTQYKALRAEEQVLVPKKSSEQALFID